MIHIHSQILLINYVLATILNFDYKDILFPLFKLSIFVCVFIKYETSKILRKTKLKSMFYVLTESRECSLRFCVENLK